MLKTLLLWTAVGVAGAAQAAPNLARHADLDLATARQLADATLIGVDQHRRRRRFGRAGRQGYGGQRQHQGLGQISHGQCLSDRYGNSGDQPGSEACAIQATGQVGLTIQR